MAQPEGTFETMSDAADRKFAVAFTKALASDAGEEARRHLAAGRPIFYGDDRYPEAVVKEYPDGRRQLVRFDGDKEVLVRDL